MGMLRCETGSWWIFLGVSIVSYLVEDAATCIKSSTHRRLDHCGLGMIRTRDPSVGNGNQGTWFKLRKSCHEIHHSLTMCQP